jgi:hypothetical protein
LVLRPWAATLVRLVPGSPCAPRRIRVSSRSDAGRVVLRARSGPTRFREAFRMGSVVKKRRKRMAKKKHRKLLRKTRVQRRRLGK